MHSCSAGRLERSLTFRTSRNFQLAPTLYNYTGDGNTFNVHFSGDPVTIRCDTLNQTGINSLLVFDIPAEIGWKVGKIPMRIFGDFANELRRGRPCHSGRPSRQAVANRYAYQAGLGIGQLKKKRDWQIEALLATPGTILAGSQPDRFRPVQRPAQSARPRHDSRIHAG